MLFRSLVILSFVFVSTISAAFSKVKSEGAGELLKDELAIQAGSVRLSQNPVKIGVLAIRGKDRALADWTATADYLSRSIEGHRFEIVPLSLAEIDEAVGAKEIDFAITNSGHYISLSAHYGGSRLVTMNARGPSSQENLTGSVIFTRASHKRIYDIKDLRGKTFMSVAPKAFCFQSAWHRMQGEGINPHKDFRKLLFVGFPQDYIAMAVRRGKVDAGNVRTGVLEAMAAEGKIKLSDFRILNPQKLKGFPYLSTTKVYPQWPFIKLKETDKALAQRVAIALLSMSPDSKAARLGDYAGWTVPLDYSSVQDLFRTLKIGPYAGLGELSLKAFFAQYKVWIISAASLLLISMLWALRTERVVIRRTKELALANEALEGQVVACQIAKEVARQRQVEVSRLAEMNSMGELASGIAHELNHPLATIANYATGSIRRLQSGEGNDDEILEVMEKVSHQANRAAQIISGLRESMRGDKRERLQTDINEIIKDAAELMELKLDTSTTKIELDLSKDLPAAMLDPIQIEQVLFNLISNGLEAIDGANSASGNLKISSFLGKDREILVSISDTGSGVADEMKTQIFNPLITTKHEGMGLGLSISLSIIKKHGGKLWLAASDENGSTFSFSLPTGEQ